MLWKEAGCTTELDYAEQTSWLRFLKHLGGLDQDRAMEAQLEGKKYAFILDEPHRWGSWAAPKVKDGRLEHNRVGAYLYFTIQERYTPFRLSSFPRRFFFRGGGWGTRRRDVFGACRKRGPRL